jgi:hypothetical protein
MKLVTLAIAIAALVLASGVYAVTRDASSGATVDVCIKPNGQLRVVTPSSPCAEPEQLDQWTVNGTKDVQTGAGLLGRSNGGIVSLQVDPDLIAKASAGGIVAGFDDGPGFVRGITRTLTLPAGAYAIFAKLTLTSGPAGAAGSATVLCRLQAGADFDESRASVPGQSTPDETKTLGMALEVAHRFTEQGAAVLSCESPVPPGCPELCFDFGHMFEDLKIVAVRASSLSNHPLSP